MILSTLDQSGRHGDVSMHLTEWGDRECFVGHFDQLAAGQEEQ